ncbi:MAG: 3D domain-containing protein [Fimbriimonadaceae bacterium]|nr:3D domain-containing protein [Fimbriimonadaceae bacterium]
MSLLLVTFGIAALAVAQTEAENQIQTETRITKIPTSVRYEFDRNLRPGAIRKVQTGQEGSIERTFRVVYENGKPVEYALVDERKTPAVPTIYRISRAGYPTSRGSFVRGRVVTMRASAYDPFPPGGSGGRTAMGLRAGYGHVAVDPRFIPLGSLLYVEGYGFAIASDTGGAIKGNRIDLCYPTRARAYQFGRRKVVVHVLKKP